MEKIKKGLKLEIIIVIISALHLLSSMAYPAIHGELLRPPFGNSSTYKDMQEIYHEITEIPQTNKMCIVSKASLGSFVFIIMGSIKKQFHDYGLGEYADFIIDEILNYLPQNSYDAAAMRALLQRERNYEPSVRIRIILSQRGILSIIFEDNGIGMDLERLKKYMEAVLDSSKGPLRETGQLFDGRGYAAASLRAKLSNRAKVYVETRDVSGDAFKKIIDCETNLTDIQSIQKAGQGTHIQIDFNISDLGKNPSEDLIFIDKEWKGRVLHAPQFDIKVLSSERLQRGLTISGHYGSYFISDAIDLRNLLERVGYHGAIIDGSGFLVIDSGKRTIQFNDKLAVRQLLDQYAPSFTIQDRDSEYRKGLNITVKGENDTVEHFVTDDEHLLHVLNFYNIKYKFEYRAIYI